MRPRPSALSLWPLQAVVLLLAGLSGCRCGQPPQPALNVEPDGTLRLEAGSLEPLAEGERLAVLTGSGEAAQREVAEILAGAVPAAGEPRRAGLRCAPMGGLVAGRYGLRRVMAGPRPCERWAEVLDPRQPTLRTSPALILPPDTALRIVRPRPAGGETVLWGRLGAPVPSEPGVFSFELLLPLDPPALTAGEAIDLGDADGKGLGPALVDAGRGMAAESLRTALDSFAVALDNVEPQKAAAALFVLADRSASRAAELSGTSGAVPGERVSAAMVWTRWVGELEKKYAENSGSATEPRPAGRQVLDAHLPLLERQAAGQPERQADLERLRALLDPRRATGGQPGRLAAWPGASAGPGGRLSYLGLEQLPEQLRNEYQTIRAIPVDLDPARFADHSPDQLRREQVAPLLAHAGRFVEQASLLASQRRQAPDPQLSCRVLSALDSIARGQKIYRSSAEELRQAETIGEQLIGRLLGDGRRECLQRQAPR